MRAEMETQAREDAIGDQIGDAGRSLGVRGTPTIVTEDGGYVP